MKMKIFAVRDRAADVFAQPFFVPTREVAIRAFGDLVNDPVKGGMVHAHPQDHDLFELGVYDDHSGLFESGTPEQIALGRDLVRSVQ